MSEQFEIIILASLTAIACALPGTFLVLRRMSLMSDAISHAILLGIVLAFFVTESLTSPWLVVGATLVGLLTVSLTELIIRSRKLKKDAAIGLVFPFLFSIGVILISRNTFDVHIDTDCVLFGEIALAPFDRLIVGTQDWGPQGFWIMGTIVLLNLFFIGLFYKELKIATFDASLAATLGFRPGVIHYGLMTLVSITAVGAFQNVGSILVVALMIAPPAAAFLLTGRLSTMLMVSTALGFLAAVSGYGMAYTLDASIAGSMATMSGVIFMIILFVAPERGIIAKYILRRWRKWDLPMETLAVHLLQAEETRADETEQIVSHMYNHMLWTDDFTSEVIAQCLEQGLIKKSGNKLTLTDYGREKAKISVSKS